MNSTRQMDIVENQPVNECREVVPGMREQAEKVEKIYVENDFAPLRSCITGNASSIFIPDPDEPELKHILGHVSEEMKVFLRQYKHTQIADSKPDLYCQFKKESDDLAKAYRKHHVNVVRNENLIDRTVRDNKGNVIDHVASHYCPEEIIKYSSGHTKTHVEYLSPYAQSMFETVGNCLIRAHEVITNRPAEFEVRECINEIFDVRDDKAVWLNMPTPYPSRTAYQPGPFLSPGDFRILPEKTLLIGIGVAKKSYIKDRSKPRSSGDELGVEVLKRMLKVYGWNVEKVYFNSKYTYHIDCLMGLVREGLVFLPEEKDDLGPVFWEQELPSCMCKGTQKWEMIEIPYKEFKLGASNNVVVNENTIVIEKEAIQTIELIDKKTNGQVACEGVGYSTLYSHFGSGIHCSTAALHREYK